MVSQERLYQIYKDVIYQRGPKEDDTPEEKELREELTKEVAEIVAKGGVPSFPFD